MSVMSEFLESNLKLQRAVSTEIENCLNGKSDKNIAELKSILNELIHMSNETGCKVFYPRTIVDSWDYTDTLGLALLDLANQYTRISK